MKKPECFDDMNVREHPCKGAENIGGPHHDEYGQCIHHWNCRTSRMKEWEESDEYKRMVGHSQDRGD